MARRQVVIIGAGQGGLSAAIHLRLKGHEVLVLEQHQVGGKAGGLEINGFRLDPGPSIIILKRLYEDVFRRAGKRMEDYLQFERLDPMSRVRFRGETIDLPADPQACFDLVTQISPADGEAFKKLYAKLKGVSDAVDRSVFSRTYTKPIHLLDPNLIRTALPFDVRKSYRELVDGMFQSELLRAFFYGFPSYGGQTYDSKAAGALLIPYLMLAEGVWYPKGGVSAIPASFACLARELGVEIREGVTVSGLVTSADRVTGVKSDQGQIAADVVVSNRDWLRTREMLGHQVDWRPSLSYWTVHYGIRRRLQGLAHHTLIVPDAFESGFSDLYCDSRVPNPPITYLNDTTTTDPATAPPGMTNLFAVVTVPGCEDGLDWDVEGARLKLQVREQLACNGYGFDDSEVVFERVQDPRYFQQRHGNFRGSLYGPAEAHRTLGLFPQGLQDPDYRGLYYCGGSVQPGAGLPMVTISGRFVADLIK
jgi:phytoene desaturase